MVYGYKENALNFNLEKIRCRIIYATLSEDTLQNTSCEVNLSSLKMWFGENRSDLTLGRDQEGCSTEVMYPKQTHITVYL